MFSLFAFAVLFYLALIGAGYYLDREQRKRKKFLYQIRLLPEEKNNVEIEVGNGFTIENDSAVYWLLDRMSRERDGVSRPSRIYKVYGALLERLNPTDMIQLARSDIREEFSHKKGDLLKFINALRLLSQRQEWRHLSFVIPPTERKFLLNWIDHSTNPDVYFIDKYINETSSAQLPMLSHLFCKKHLSRFVKVFSENYEFGVCRKCNGSQHGLIVERSTLLFVEKAKWKTYLRRDYLWINGLLLDKLCDFDRIVVGACDLEHIERFCIMVGNDTDTYRVDRYKSIRYKFLRNATRVGEADVLLRRFFRPLRELP